MAGEVLALLAVQLASARADEMPALAADAKTTMGRIVKCCMDTRVTRTPPARGRGHVRDELVSLGRALEAQLAGIIELRWAQLAGSRPSRTRH